MLLLLSRDSNGHADRFHEDAIARTPLESRSLPLSPASASDALWQCASHRRELVTTRQHFVMRDERSIYIGRRDTLAGEDRLMPA
jgi:hypothetical protein